MSGKYAKCVNDVASVLGLPFLDLWGKMQFTSSGEKREGWQQFLSDGVHLTSLGNKFMGESMIELIDQLIPELSVNPCPQTGSIDSASECRTLQRIGQWHDEVDNIPPKKTFDGGR